MFSIPAGSVFSKGCIRLGGELGTEACFVITGNPGRLARTWAGGKGAIGCPARQPAFDRRVTDLEGAHHLGTRHAGIKRVKHAFSEIERVCFHWCVLYHKLIFSAHYYSVAALAIALVWNLGTGLDGTVLRWGLTGMALVRLGLSWPTWQDLFSGKVAALAGPLRKIQFHERRALATEDGPIVVLPVERSLFAAHEAGIPATIYYAAKSKRVVAVLPGRAATAQG